MDKEIYILNIKQNNKEDYNIPMSLENIDYYFSNFDKQTIIENLKSYDSVIEIHNNPKICTTPTINRLVDIAYYTKGTTIRNIRQ